MYKAKIMKSSNRDRILECIYRNPRISRKEISDITGITPATVTTTTAAMVKEGIITELGQVGENRKSIGRSPIALAVNGNHRWVIGVEFTKDALTVCATDLHGNILNTYRIPYAPDRFRDISGLVIQSVKNCTRSVSPERGSVVAIGIGVPGHMDRGARHIICSNELWTGFDGEAVRNAFSCPVVMENNVRCMAMARYLHTPEETPSNFAMLHIGKGIFCASVVEDQLRLDATYGSGEIGHTIAVPDGRRCDCGKRGCLQTVAAEAALLESAAMVYEMDAQSMLHNFADSAEALTVTHVAAAYAMGDPAVRRVVTHVLRHVAMASLNIAILMNPEKLLVHGRLFNDPAIRQDFLEMVGEQFDFTKNNYNLGIVEIVETLDTDGAVGAAAYAILQCVVHKG